MSTYSDSEILEQVQNDKKDILIYLFENNEASVKKELSVKGASEEDCRAVLEDALVLFWGQVQNNTFILNEGVNFQIQQLANDLWTSATSASKAQTEEDKYVSPEEKLKKYITTNTTVKYVSYNRGKVGVSIPLFVLISIAVIWFVIEYKPVEIRTISKFIRIPSYITSDKNEPVEDMMKEKEEKKIKPINVNAQKTNRVSRNSDSIAALIEDSLNSVSLENQVVVELDTENSSDTTREEDIVVRKDVLLSVKTIKATARSMVDNVQDADDKSLAKELTDKLNPEAKLPEPEIKTKTYQVEFWQSPINFKGYKMSKNKIVLFGIDEPGLLKIYTLDNSVYIGHYQNIYKLESTDDFMSLNKIKDSTILTLLK